MQLRVLDTTLRDGTQQKGANVSVHDKIEIAKKLDKLGIQYIEGGWPGSNPKDVEFFKEAKKLKLKNSEIVAFCSTCYKKNKAKDDPNLIATVKSGVKTAVIFGKSWDLHVKDILGVSLKKNLEMIESSVAFLTKKKIKVIFDAEHFFDGYKSNPDYVIQSLKAAEKGGTVNLSLCDTNGGTLTQELKEIIQIVKKNTKVELGIHVHNDCDLAVANTLAAVEEGVKLIQGTINGYGERTGNTNLCSVIPNLQLKMGYQVLPKNNLKKLYYISQFVTETLNFKPFERSPYVGDSAFTHKAGVHASAMLKNSKSYEHIEPELIGNERHFTISELSGKSNVIALSKELGIKLSDKQIQKVLKKVKNKEKFGFHYEGAEASFELLLHKLLKGYKTPFELVDYLVTSQYSELEGEDSMDARVTLQKDGKFYHTFASGNGPVSALDTAMRKTLEKIYPKLKDVSLIDYKVRIFDIALGTFAKTRVLIQMRSGNKYWTTVGCSSNIIVASLQALVDGYEYALAA